MANLTFYARGRRRRIYRRHHGGPFYVRFQVNGRNHPRSTGTTCEAAAKEIAKQIVEAEVDGNIEVSRRLKIRSDYCPVREVCAIYLRKFGTDDRRRRTARGNIQCLAKILRLGAGVGDLDAKTEILTGELIRKYEVVEEKRITRDSSGRMDPESELRVRTTIGSTLKQARSIFKDSRLDWYDGLILPKLERFRKQGVTTPDRPKPRPLDDGVMDQVNAAAPLLARTDPECHRSHLMFKYLGMRNREQKFARRSWLRHTPQQLLVKGIAAQFGVIYRAEEGFKPKKKTERWIPIAPSILAQLEKDWQPSPDGDFLIYAQNKTEREIIVDRRHAAWAGQWIRGRCKVSYELRRYAGSLIYRKTGRIEHVQQFLGHADIKTTLDWYWYLLDETPAIDLADCAPAVFKVVA